MNNDKLYIGLVAKELGISQRTIRYYEELGFIKPLRTDGKFRTYALNEINKIRAILKLKDLGMTLEDIRTLLHVDCSDSLHELVTDLRKNLLKNQQELKNKIKKYTQGITDIDEVLSFIARCEQCGKSKSKPVCEKCINDEVTSSSDLIKAIL